MSIFKSLVDRVKEKKDELQREALKRAAKGTLKAAGSAVEGTVDRAGKALERVIFGDEVGGEPKDAEAEGEGAAEARPDPFAKQKAAEVERSARKHEEERRSKERALREKKLDAEVDEELAALKKRLGK